MRRTLEQFLAVFNSLAPSQRITFAAITVLIPVGFLFFAWNGSSSSMVALSYGKVFSLDEQRNAEQALKEAGLTKFRSEGRQISRRPTTWKSTTRLCCSPVACRRTGPKNWRKNSTARIRS